MKQLKYIFIIIAHFYSISCYGQAYGIVISQIVTTNMIQRAELNYFSDEQTYATGGATFTYPSSWFSGTPLINVSIAPTSSHPATETYTVEISANSPSSTTIMVYLISFGVVSEAPAGSVTIYLFALDSLSVAL